MENNPLNGPLVAAHLSGHLNARIRMAADNNDYETAISHLKALLNAYNNLEFNTACHEWVRDWKEQLQKYERLRITNIKK
jgi:hypothetical protein